MARQNTGLCQSHGMAYYQFLKDIGSLLLGVYALLNRSGSWTTPSIHHGQIHRNLCAQPSMQREHAQHTKAHYMRDEIRPAYMMVTLSPCNNSPPQQQLVPLSRIRAVATAARTYYTYLLAVACLQRWASRDDIHEYMIHAP